MTHVLDARLAALRSAGRSAADRGRTIAAVALERTAQDPARVVVIDGERRIARAELLDMACRLGAALAARGIRRGAAIGFQLPNWWEACVVNLAAALFGHRLVPLLTIYREAELGFILEAAGVEALFVPERFRNVDYPALIGRLPVKPRHLFVVRGEAGGPDAFEALLGAEPGMPEPAGSDDLKMLLYTSGSTGRPKGVLHAHDSIDALIRNTAAFWRLGPDDVLYVPSPIGHIGGSIYAFEYPWTIGCTAVLAERWAAGPALAEMNRRGVTFMAGATPFLQDLVAAVEHDGASLVSLRRFVCGGASVPPDLVRRGLDAFPNAVVARAYGSTEVPVICPGVRDRAEAYARADTDGECTADVRLLDEAGREVAPGEAGEIVVRSPHMFLGYLEPADEADAFAPGGYFRMGDLGRRVAGRFLEITGRKKDIIIRKGENISPMEIENALARHPAVDKAVVIGVPDPQSGEAVMAVVVPRPGSAFDFAAMTAHLAAQGLARQKFPTALRLVPALPTNAVGKVQKAELRALVLQSAAGGGA